MVVGTVEPPYVYCSRWEQMLCIRIMLGSAEAQVHSYMHPSLTPRPPLQGSSSPEPVELTGARARSSTISCPAGVAGGHKAEVESGVSVSPARSTTSLDRSSSTTPTLHKPDAPFPQVRTRSLKEARNSAYSFVRSSKMSFRNLLQSEWRELRFMIRFAQCLGPPPPSARLPCLHLSMVCASEIQSVLTSFVGPH